MSIFSKKQLLPLITKYDIKVESNQVFNKIVNLFPNQTNYQIWAIKSVYGANGTQISDIVRIKEWADTHANDIKNLSKGNIVAYKTAEDIAYLLKEMDGINRINTIKHSISKFNTRQRNMLTEDLFAEVDSPYAAYASNKLKEWENIFKQMETLVPHRKEKLISTASAIDNMALMKSHISSALSASYSWNREDMLSFMQRNAPDCNVVFDKDNVVVISVPSFNSSKLLCGNGRTGWCLTREDSYFRQYVTSYHDAKQYFLFDFNKREDNDLAHIGFTVRRSAGITNAHSTMNRNMLGTGITVDGQHINIKNALSRVGVTEDVYISFEPLNNYKWNYGSIIEFINQNNGAQVAYADGNRIICKISSGNALSKLIGHTFISTSTVDVSNKNNNIFLLMDTSKEIKASNSYVLMAFAKDKYEYDELTSVINGYGNKLNSSEFLESEKLTVSTFFKRKPINPNIMLHKLIDEDKEAEIVSLINANADTIDVNYQFNQSVPIFRVIEKGMVDAFKAIINSKTFDINTCDVFGDNLLQSLIYNYNVNGSQTLSQKDKNISEMINSILDCESFDFNWRDMNFDTALITSCARKELAWITDVLVHNPKVNINLVNDVRRTALSTAIRARNTEAISILGIRPDLVVSKDDYSNAYNFGLDLSALLHPNLNMEIAPEATHVPEADSSLIYDISEIFAKAFGISD